MKNLVPAIASFLLILLSLAGVARADEPGVCAHVKLEIPQELTFERIAFEGRLRVSNDNADIHLTDVLVELYIYDANGDEPTTPAFFVQAPTVEGSMAGIPDGSGMIPAGGSAAVTWLFIPTIDAGGEDPRGQEYYIGGAFYANANGELLSFPLYPDRIVVKPQPKLDIDYFLPREVMANDPFTDQIEESIPFDLGVRIRNAGFGPANNMVLSSGQPKIVENEKGLLVAFRLLEGFTHGEPQGNPSLTMNFGDLGPHESRVGRWSMISTLMGRFVEFDAQYTHAPDLGGELTSLIVSLDANWLVKTMLIDEPGFDDVHDFLADTESGPGTAELVPDTIFSSEGQEFPVNVVSSSVSGSPSDPDSTVRLTMNNPPTGWVYTKIDDPSQGLLDLVAVTRSDGKHVLVPENAWITKRIVRRIGQPTRTEFTFHVVDVNTTGVYDLTFEPPPPDENPPETRPIVQEPFFGTDPLFYGTDETEVFLFAEDDISGVANTLWSINGSPYAPAFPIRFPDEGTYEFEYYSVDRAGNAEPASIFTLIVDLTPPVIDMFEVPGVFVPAHSPSGTDALFVVPAQATDNAIPVVDLTLEIVSASNPEGTPVFTRTDRVPGGVPHALLWDGRLASGAVAAPGSYIARLIAADPLGHSVSDEKNFVIAEPFESRDLFAGNGEQIFPHIDGDIAVWQDSRDGTWNVYQYNLETDEGGPVLVYSANQERPRISGNRVVFQDNRSGGSAVYMQDLSTGQTTQISGGGGSHSRPDIDGDHIVWQGTDGGLSNIYLYNISTGNTVSIAEGTQPKSNPRVHAGMVVYEDFSGGLSDVIVYDIAAEEHLQLTSALEQQDEPDIHAGRVVWTDKRGDLFREIYSRLLPGGEERNLTNDSFEQAEPSAAALYTAFTDYKPSIADPNIAVAIEGRDSIYALTTDPSQQRRPATSGFDVVWQDQRSGRWQIRATTLRIPIADAGPDQITSADFEVQLDGTQSLDLAGNELAYAWTQLAGPAVTLEGANTATPSFIAPELSREQMLIFSLVVSNNQFDSAPDTVIVRVRPQNLPPVADAGPDRTVMGRELVMLDGRGSYDPDDDPLTPHWQVESIFPPVELEGANTFQPTFRAPDVTTETLVLMSLRVSDGQFTSVPDLVEISVVPRVNQPPVAVIATALQEVDEETLVTLDGSPSYDPEDLPITFEWTQTGGPAVTLDLTDPSRPTFLAPDVVSQSDLTFRLLVYDEELASDPATATVVVNNVRRAPVARAGNDRTINEGEEVTLDGTDSFHPEGVTFSYLWVQVSGPPVTLDNPNSPEPSFIAPVLRRNYTLEFRLTTLDGLQTSVPDVVKVNVISSNNPPVADAGEDQRLVLEEPQQVQLDGSASFDPDDDPITYQWTQVQGITVELQNATTATPHFITPADLPTTIVFQLIVNDDGYDSEPSFVTITLLGMDGTYFILY